MSNQISRREAIAAGAVTAGALLGTSATPAQAESLKPVWGDDFLTQWSAPDKVKKDLTAGHSHIRLSCGGYGLNKPKAGETWAAQVKAVRDAGFTAVEAYGHTWDYSITENEITEILGACKQYDVEFYGLHVWANIIDPDPEKRKKNLRIHIQACDMAERFGMKFILTHTGGRNAENKDLAHPLNWTKETWEMSVAAVKEILKSTSGSKTNLAFEAVNSSNNNNPQSHVRLKQDVGDDRVKVCLDPANMLYAGTYFRTTELINLCFDLIGEDIMYAHAKDKLWRDMMPRFEPAILGQGGIDYEQYLARLSRLKYPRCLFIEHLPQDQYPPSKKYIEDTAKKLGVKIYS